MSRHDGDIRRFALEIAGNEDHEWIEVQLRRLVYLIEQRAEEAVAEQHGMSMKQLRRLLVIEINKR